MDYCIIEAFYLSFPGVFDSLQSLILVSDISYKS